MVYFDPLKSNLYQKKISTRSWVQWFRGSAPPLTAEAASLIEKETPALRSHIRGFTEISRPTSKVNERTVNQQKTSILSGEATLRKIAKQYYFWHFFCLYSFTATKALKHKKHMNSQANRTIAKVQILSLWVQRSILTAM